MGKPKSERKRRSDRFSLTLHPTRQNCKRINGMLYCFGCDKQKALKNYRGGCNATPFWWGSGTPHVVKAMLIEDMVNRSDLR